MEFAFVFPGQGSQSVGMVKDFAESFPLVKENYQEASDVIEVDLWKLVQEGPAEELNQTSITQPAMLAASYSIWQIWNNSASDSAIACSGHSFGEISALTCTGAISYGSAIFLARKRGEIMQSAVPQGTGAMAAILGLDDASLDDLCKSISGDDNVVEAVNYNAPGQVVVAGHSVAVDSLIELAKEKGAKRALKLPVSVPAHSSLMKQAADKFAQVLADISFELPAMPVIQNAILKNSESTDELEQALIAQLYSPVQWVDSVGILKEAGASCLVELGPGKVLTGLQKRIDKSLKSLCVSDNQSLEAAIKAIEE